MPTATMTSAPKKKRDFFNGSQGLDLRDFRSPEPQGTQEGMVPGGACDFDGARRTSDSYSPVGFLPPQDVGGHSSAEYPFPTPFPNRQSPPGYYGHPGPDRCPPIAQSRVLEFGDSVPLVEASAPYPSGGALEHPSWTAPAQVSPTGDDNESVDGKKKGKKRKQRCRMCANHGIYVEIKGHKWYCPYKNLDHSCDKCEITRKRQYFMAKQQQLTREQQQHMQRGSEAEPGKGECAQAPITPSFASKHSDFPRMKELLEETDHILDEELFRQIDECVRPKVTHH